MNSIDGENCSSKQLDTYKVSKTTRDLQTTNPTVGCYICSTDLYSLVKYDVK